VKFTETELAGVILVQPDVFEDARGLFLETYHERKYKEAGIPGPFVQDNFSYSVKGTLRGLHYQLSHAQGKLVAVTEGAIFDVAVDIRRGSPTFGQWVGVELSAKSRHQLYVPPGFAHGFCVTSERAGVMYKVTDFYSPKDERGVIWNDPTIGVQWPTREPLLSPKDQGYRSIALMTDELPAYGQ
jgi:dTDP-4-dehydrorhamnose 3,5-epimerase